jgi:ATP-dependent Lhr-like helicase
MSKKTVLPSVLTDIFSPATRDWFVSAFQHPTPVQAQTWTATNAGEHVLAIAPTGSGKTLAAFLYALDQLFREGDTLCGYRRTEKTTRILYISPIKALGTDIQRNLQIPLQGISEQRKNTVRRKWSSVWRCARGTRQLRSGQRLCAALLIS